VKHASQHSGCGQDRQPVNDVNSNVVSYLKFFSDWSTVAVVELVPSCSSRQIQQKKLLSLTAQLLLWINTIL